jgi:hypothetical protein
MQDASTRQFSEVLAAERAHIQHSRARAAMPDELYTGLAISGGGIRSACFALGVLQALVAGNILKKMDYLSTSSGGGYIGAALTWFLSRGCRNQEAGVEPDNFPLGKPRTASDHPQNSALDFIRMHGNYLTPAERLNKWSLAGLILRTSLISLVAYFTLLSTLMLVPMALGFFRPVTWLDFLQGTPLSGFLHNYFWLAALLILLLFIVQCLVYALYTGIPGVSTRFSYGIRTAAQQHLGRVLSGGLLCIILGTIPWLHNWSNRWLASLNITEDYLQGVMAAASAALGSIMGFAQYVRSRRGAGASNSWVIFLASALILYGMAYAAYVANVYIAKFDAARWFFFAGGVLALVLGLFVNANYLGLHRMYRDRLMEAFLPNRECVERNAWGMASDADAAMLETFCKAPNERPLHLINSNLVLSHSSKSKYNSRGGDSFLLSPLYSGSAATGWIKTADWQRKPGEPRGQSGITLASAMAVSGASVNPNAGNSGRGPTRSRLVSTLLTLLNIRLGYWVVNPASGYQKWFKPNLVYPGLNGTLFGPGLHEEQPVVELSDGGHFDNLGIYELIRRGVKLIILSDAGADGAYHFDDLGNAIEKVRVDFGVKIKFNDEYSLENVQPGSAQLNTPSGQAYAKHGFATASIEYPDKSTGRLIYLKATLIEGLPADVYNYLRANSAFPHEPTADQFFSEVQIEAYRELGYQITWDMLNKNGYYDVHSHWQPDRHLDQLKPAAAV